MSGAGARQDEGGGGQHPANSGQALLAAARQGAEEGGLQAERAQPGPRQAAARPPRPRPGVALHHGGAHHGEDVGGDRPTFRGVNGISRKF